VLIRILTLYNRYRKSTERVIMIAIFLAEGFEVCEALTQIDLLRRARLDIKSFSITDSKDVLSSHGVVVKCDGTGVTSRTRKIPAKL
jgi:putative intracellular protease/amidase